MIAGPDSFIDLCANLSSVTAEISIPKDGKRISYSRHTSASCFSYSNCQNIDFAICGMKDEESGIA
jgi:hypothetical protein